MKYMHEKAKEFKKKIGNLAKCADDNTALDFIEFYEVWNPNAKYKKGDRLVYNNKLYKVIKNHWGSDVETPDKATQYYSEIVAM